MSTTTTPELKANLEELKKNILELASIGRNEKDRGIYRMAFTDKDMEAREWLKGKINEYGLESKQDGAGNIFGIFNGNKKAPSILLGSHIDTVPSAGALDGTLGVLTALECLRTLKQNGMDTDFPIEMVSFSDEEGRFGGMFGSQSMCGKMNPEKLFSAADLDGIKLTDELKRHGMEPMEALDAARHPNTIKHYLELHIEQGPVLDRLDKQVGLVTEITGLFKWQITLKGTANHAGTTPMNMRNDAFMGVAEFAHEIPRIIDENGAENSRATIGKVSLFPGSPNTVPGRVDFSLDVRDTSEEVLHELQEAIRKALSAIARKNKLMFEFEELSFIKPVKCDKEIFEALKKSVEKLGLRHEIMPSGAAHDAQIVGKVAPIGMIFVPSKNGLSHSPKEWTSWDDIDAGANLMLQAICSLANAK